MAYNAMVTLVPTSSNGASFPCVPAVLHKQSPSERSCDYRASLKTDVGAGINVTYKGTRVLVETDSRFLYVGAIFVVLIPLTVELQGFTFFTLAIQASRTLHRQMFGRVLGAPITFFETNPLGIVHQ